MEDLEKAIEYEENVENNNQYVEEHTEPYVS